jgi:hypothetical protein
MEIALNDGFHRNRSVIIGFVFSTLTLYSGSRSNGSQTRKKGTGSRPSLNLSHRRFGLRAVCLSPFSVRYTSVIRCRLALASFGSFDDTILKRALKS